MEPKAPSPRPPSFPSLSTFPRWWSRDTVAVVTGANKGIGYAVVKRLAQMGMTVVLTARDAKRGGEALESLRALGLFNVHFFCLDVSDPNSITIFAAWFNNNFSGLDILVNNAAVSFNDTHENSVEHAETVVNTNFHGPKLLTETLLPFFRLSSIGRILNMSSRLGSLDKVKNPRIRKMLQGEDLSEEQIDEMVTLFLQNVKSGEWKSQGWPEIWTDYAVSKVALNAYTKILAKKLESRGISVNCLCPGFTRTSMTGGKGTCTADQAAEMTIRLALLPPHQLPTGRFFMNSTSNPVTNARL